MTTREGLMAAILAAPDDDLPRLVFADWLEENGEVDRAEFIRVQCEIEKHKPEAVNYVRNGRYKREDAVRLDWRLVALHDREMQLLWAKHHEYDSANWELWCHAEAREEDGTPCCVNGRGGMSVTPHGSIGLGEGSNSCVVPFSFTEAGPPYDSHGRQVVQYFRRGFVSEIRCTFDGWFGSLCGPCRGQGRLWNGGWDNRTTQIVQPEEMIYCPRCYGEGATPAIGPAVLRSHPVTRITFRDKVPRQITSGGVVWEPGFDYSRPHQVSFAVAEAGKWKASMINGLMVYKFTTTESATDAMSNAAIEWAKSVTPSESSVQQRTEELA